MTDDPILIWAACNVCGMPVHVHPDFLDAIAEHHRDRVHPGSDGVRFEVDA